MGVRSLAGLLAVQAEIQGLNARNAYRKRGRSAQVLQGEEAE